MAAAPVTPHDLDYVLEQTRDLWGDARGRRLLITGGTGFVGCWLLETALWANDRLKLGASVTVIAREPQLLRQKAPHLADHSALTLHTGDILSDPLPGGEFQFIVHAATETNVKLDFPDPLRMFLSSVEGTRRMLEFARVNGGPRFLLLSSGAVYGRQPPDLPTLSEEHCGAPPPTAIAYAYGHGKRAAEFLCAAYAQTHGIQAMIARCFAFVGPYLPLDSGFAIGNFVRDALQGGPIRLTSDGTPYRSYMYAADMAIWLWTILFRGQPARPYNVGSDQPVAIAELAERIGRLLLGDGRFELVVPQAPALGTPADRYVPCVDRARSELGLAAGVGLDGGIVRFAEWARRLQTSASAGVTATPNSPPQRTSTKTTGNQ